jgi:MFS family permease
MLVGWPLAAAATSRLLVRVGYRKPVQLGAVLTALALAATVPLVSSRAAPWTLGMAMFVFGVGMGLVNTAVVIGIQASVGWEQRGVVTATNMFARSMGGAVGVGGMGAMLASRLDGTLSPDVASALLDPHRRAEVLGRSGVVEALGVALDPLFVAAFCAGAVMLVVLMAHPRDSKAVVGALGQMS